MVEGLKPVHRAALLKAYGSADQVFRQGEMELTAAAGIKPEMAYQILHFDRRMAEAEARRAREAGLQIVCLADGGYPALLKSIPEPPLVLYVRGVLAADEELSVAIVGSRKATPYGLNATHMLVHDLATARVTVVSGLARGVDARAHNACLQAGGRTIAVLGSGLDVIYPSEHKHLAARIAEQGGAVISEFPLGTPPNRENFPIRNRIISGLSSAVVVVEASRKSGSLITARMAIEQGREVLAVPGSIFNESSQGCNALIQDGAGLAQTWKDIVAALPGGLSRERLAAAGSDETAEKDLTETEKSLIGLLSFDQPKHIDELAAAIGMKAQRLLGELVNLELRSYICQMPGKLFLRAK